MTDFEIHTFDEIPIGYTKNFSVKIDEEMLDNFANISGDFNPLHMDEQYAKTTQFKGRVCHGMLLTSFFSRLIGMYVPGKYGLYFSQTLNFVNPTTVNDTVTVTGKVISKNESTKIIKLKTTIKSIPIIIA